MNEQELFKKETFLELFKLSEIDRIAREDELYLIAKGLGCEKRFKDSLKKYEKILNDDILLVDDNKLPHSKYEIDKYNFGIYLVTKDGIYNTLKKNKFSTMPIIPVERYINQETNKEKIKIIYYQEKKWKELIVDRSQICINNKLLLLSDYGLDINSENVKDYINYFNEILSSNNINKLSSISHIGWQDNLFIPYDSQGIFDGADSFKSIYESITSKGNYDKWKSVIKELRKNKYIRIIMATTLASPLIEKLNIPTFIVNVWSAMSGSGKTLSCMAAMSIWGNPKIGGLTLSSNNTQNYYTTVASFMNNFTCFFDELQIIKNNKNIDFNALIMDLCNGTEKGRLTKESQTKEVKSWKNNFIFTNNDRMVNENAGEQIYNRVIDLEINSKIIDKGGQDVARIIKENYGFAGRDYIKYIQKVGFDNIFEQFKELYETILNNSQATDKQANSLACILLADKLANECIFDDGRRLYLEDLKDYINDKNEIKTSIKAKNYIINIINANYKKFEDIGYGEVWGIKNDYSCTINAEILYRELKKGGFEFNTIKKEWAEMGFLKKNSADRYIQQTTVRAEKGNYAVLNLYNED